MSLTSLKFKQPCRCNKLVQFSEPIVTRIEISGGFIEVAPNGTYRRSTRIIGRRIDHRADES
jgi:hypothetical protein